MPAAAAAAVLTAAGILDQVCTPDPTHDAKVLCVKALVLVRSLHSTNAAAITASGILGQVCVTDPIVRTAHRLSFSESVCRQVKVR